MILWNRLFKSPVNKTFYRNGNKITCRTQLCSDGTTIILEPVKKYGAAILVANRFDINYTSMILDIDFKTVERYYHTEKNLERILKMIGDYDLEKKFKLGTREENGNAIKFIAKSYFRIGE